jgi:16S rRNA (adenine1518-N6/adenine1519-N6)-dimethyltransferase
MNPKTLLEQYDIAPRKSLGQNFLHDPNMLDKIVATAGLRPEDTVLEVGPGTGLLTERLARTVARVVTVEVDERLKPVLEEILAPYENVELIFKDILHVDVETMMGAQPYSVVANVPYYITSAILRHLLEIRRRPRRLVLTVQLEVAERLIARPDDMSILAVSVQFYGRPQIVARLKPSVFWPRPDVDSALVLIETFEQPPVEIPNEKLFFRVVRAGFGQKRKQLKNSISSGLDLNAEQAFLLFRRAEIDPSRRPETLTLPEWAALARAFAGL